MRSLLYYFLLLLSLGACKDKSNPSTPPPNQERAAPGEGEAKTSGDSEQGAPESVPEGTTAGVINAKELAATPGAIIGDGVYVPVPTDLPGGGKVGQGSGFNLADDGLSIPAVTTPTTQTSTETRATNADFTKVEKNSLSKIVLKCADPAFNPSENEDSTERTRGGWVFYVRARKPVSNLVDAYNARKNKDRTAESRATSIAFARMEVFNVIPNPDKPGEEKIEFCPGILTSLKYFKNNENIWLEGLFVYETPSDSGVVELDTIFSELLSDPFLPGRPNSNTRFIEKRLIAEETQVRSFVDAGPGSILAIGADNQAYSRLDLKAPWVKAGPEVNRIKAIASLPNGPILGVLAINNSLLVSSPNLDGKITVDPKFFKGENLQKSTDYFVLDDLEVNFINEILGVRRYFEISNNKVEERDVCTDPKGGMKTASKARACHTLIKRGSLGGEWLPELRMGAYEKYLDRPQNAGETLVPRPGKVRAIADMPDGSFLMASVEEEYFDASEARIQIKTNLTEAQTSLDQALTADMPLFVGDKKQKATDKIQAIKSAVDGLRTQIDTDLAEILKTSAAQTLVSSRSQIDAIAKLFSNPGASETEKGLLQLLPDPPPTTPPTPPPADFPAGASNIVAAKNKIISLVTPLAVVEMHGRKLIRQDIAGTPAHVGFAGGSEASAYVDKGKLHRRKAETDSWEHIPYNARDYIYRSKFYNFSYLAPDSHFFMKNVINEATHPCAGNTQQEIGMKSLTASTDGTLLGVYADDGKLYYRRVYEYKDTDEGNIATLVSTYLKGEVFDSKKHYLTFKEFNTVRERQIALLKSGTPDTNAINLTIVHPYDCIAWKRVEDNNDMSLLSVSILK